MGGGGGLSSVLALSSLPSSSSKPLPDRPKTARGNLQKEVWGVRVKEREKQPPFAYLF